MSGPSARREGFGLLGIGAVACLACCAGPILALLGGISLAGLLSTAVIGTVGLVVAGAAAVAFLLVRRRRQAACAADAAEPVPLPTPTRRQPDRTS